MVCVSISHSGSNLAPRGAFFPPKCIYIGLCMEYPTSGLCLRSQGLQERAAAPAHGGAVKDPTPKHLGVVSSPHPKFPSLSSRREFLCQPQRVGQAGIPGFQEPKLAARVQGCCSQDAAGAENLLWPLDWHFCFFKFYLLWPKEESLSVPL